MLLFKVIVGSIFLLTTAVNALQVHIIPKKDVMTLSVGKSIMLTCELNQPGGRAQWFDNNGHEITSTTGRVTVERGPNSSRLYVKDIIKTDAGTYKCVGTHQGVTSPEATIRLAIFQDITYTHVPNPQHPAEHSNATIACKVEGEPTPEVSWKYNGKPIQLGSTIKQTPIGLNITRITQDQNGNYTCIARVQDTGSYEERVITVKVHVPPKVSSKGTMKIEGLQGTNASLTCSATGLPLPKYEFYKDKDTKALVTSGNVVVDNDYGKIYFRPLRKQNNGTYVCKALNDVGDDEIEGSVTVNVHPKVTDLNNLTLAEGSQARLFCKSEGLPYPAMNFRKAGRTQGPFNIGANDGGRIIISSKNGGELLLTIDRVSPSDAGNYTCSSSNKIGRHMLTASLVVEHIPRFVEGQPKKVYSWVGNVRNITCEVDAHPPPRFRWLRNHRELANVTDKYRIYTSGKVSNLEVRVGMNDNDWKGDYICEATNSRGKVDVKIGLEEAVPPGKPSHIEVKDVTPNMIVLAVRPPTSTGGVNIVGYRVEYGGIIQDFETGFPDGYYLNIPEGFTANKEDPVEIRIENLKPETKYSFKIRSKNEVGIGREFITHNATTVEIREPYPVKVISPRVGTESHSYTLVWAPPQTGGRPVNYYNISYCKATVDKTGNPTREGAWRDSTTIDNPKRPLTRFTIHNLEPESTYMLRIVAGNEMTAKKPAAKLQGNAFIFETSKVNPLKSSSRAGISIYFGSTIGITALTLLQVFNLVLIELLRKLHS